MTISKTNRIQLAALIILLLLLFTGLQPCPTGQTKPGEKPGHPQVLSPDKTLRVFLEAFIARDIDTVMAYIPGRSDQGLAKWREKYRKVSLGFMKDDKHIKKILSINVQEIKKNGNDSLAIMTASLETTPQFSGMAVTDSSGKTTVTYRWVFLQSGKNTHWVLDGGGF